MMTDLETVRRTVGDNAREALGEIRAERAPVRYLATRSAPANVSPVLVDVTNSPKVSSGFANFLAGAACAALILAALYFSL